MANILVIAGSDPTGQAGIQADLRTVRQLGHRGLSVLTAVTAQNDNRIYSVNALDSRVLLDQLRAILDTYPVDAVKIGLLGTKQIAYQIYRILGDHRFPNVVVDPVMHASCGSILLEDAALPILTSYLLPLARVVTPNLDEAEVMAEMTVRNTNQMALAAKHIFEICKGVGAVLIKGGHLREVAVDVLYDGIKVHEFPSLQNYPVKTRGTGCVLSSALASYLTRGYDLPEAIWAAKAHLDRVIATAPEELPEQLSFIESA